MTEYNYFCRNEIYNNDNSFQQKRYRVFNVDLNKEEYSKIKKIYHKLDFDFKENYKTRFKTAFKKMWDGLSKEEQQEYLDIPHFCREGFTFITGIKPQDCKSNDVEEMTLSEVCKALGKNVKIVKE